MCGIFAYLGHRNNAGEIVLEGLKSLEYRGYDSWGVVAKKTDRTMFLQKQTGKIGTARLPDFTSSIGIGHTRWATHGGVTKNNSHPHTDCTGTVYVVHNGIVENFQELKRDLLHRGHIFKSETDTEVIAHLLEEKIGKGSDPTEAVMELFKKTVKGLNAFIIFLPKSDHFIAIKNSSPLVFGYDRRNKEFYISSDYAGILSHTNELYYLEDNELLSIDRDGYTVFDGNGKKKHIAFTPVTVGKDSLALGKFPHFMLKEISEQPKVLSNIVHTYRHTIENLADQVKKAYGTYLIACGSAYYASLAGTYLFSKIAKRHTNSSIASEFSYLEDFLTPKSLVIALSQSGETIDLISSVKKAREKGTKVCAITNVLGSTLYRLADYKILLSAGPEKCVLATKSFTAKIAILHLLAHSLDGGYQEGAKQMISAITEAEKVIVSKKPRTIAALLKRKEHIFVLGRGISYATALEAALKIKEGSYIHAEGFAAGELKHGVIALIERGTPVIVFNPQDETYEDTLSSTYEVKARGAYVIGVSSKNSPAYDEFIRIKHCDEATMIPHIVFAQLLGYYLTVQRGHDPDKPRNLAKSVTVK